MNRSALLKAAVTNAALEGSAVKDPALPKPRRMGKAAYRESAVSMTRAGQCSSRARRRGWAATAQARSQPASLALYAGMLGLGRALRVTPGSTPAASTASEEPDQATASADDADAANRKRKAEAEAAHSPKPPMATGDFKRRSPANEVRQQAS